MEIKEYYNVGPATDTIISSRLARRVVNSDAKFRGCPECRLLLREIHRHNRIVKASLDKSTKWFIITASSTYKKLVGAVQSREEHSAVKDTFITLYYSLFNRPLYHVPSR